MCFFDQTLYRCGDYKWKTFRQHCAKEYRTGETCGMKLIMNCVEDRSKSCKICGLIATKLRRRQKEVERIKRWKSEGNRKASIGASEDIIDDLDGIIYTLERERLKRRSHL
jgi:hypothetical protein